ncbi:hypothetical protein A2X44_02160 [candidate division CPR3 bacterium GWF2_35_18]|uniref:Uncharacterized protein n=1 Tax=candidate division CPR3 bacterium GW2011_GWF2_35_18 TaxID=1618350 RepID=A0A0G0E3U1_UNCC3|nr:MAG: hypothetical protein UR67_C0002G0115 [candidate division CPR3 bacterium GW2011_GWF2_35_18]OGB62802.1 MAG: hypothetical protein A2X44_02160 [candidate division CPR3 bacterium GWF2_35_18]OGB65383.1 MAG: hypothetical protein A2250_00375 [candidate division CPR3 bacterium RIFOXYA2_FULL_35_13]OGB75593.1 MAG: hypothetical protein A2476_03245 [candidate division CPR3 bacterium RIFOXYC2_FULL_35_7]
MNARPSIILPHTNGMTTLATEVAFLESLLGWRMDQYHLPKETDTAMAVLKIILGHTENCIKLSDDEKIRLWDVIQQAINLQQPVPITISFAVGSRMPNLLKFKELIAYPTLGWLHMAWVFRFINEKIQRIYKPGMQILLFDEATLFAGVIPGIVAEDVERQLQYFNQIITAIGAPITIIPMTPEMLPWEQAQHIPMSSHDAITYAMACCYPGMTNPDAMDPLYTNRAKDYLVLRMLIGEETWQTAITLSERVLRTLALRKQNRLFERLLNDLGFQNHINACITDKSERVVIDVTKVLTNHGMPVVYRDANGRLVVHIVPEYRLQREHPGAIPVRISPNEFGTQGVPFVFYYLGK